MAHRSLLHSVASSTICGAAGPFSLPSMIPISASFLTPSLAVAQPTMLPHAIMLLVSSYLLSPAIFMSSATYSLSLPPLLAFLFYYARRSGGGVGVAGRPPIHMVRSRIDMPSGRAMWCTTLAHPTHYAAAISSYSISDHLSCLLPRPFLSASSFPPHLLFLAASIPAPRLLATSPSRLLLACGCSSPWAASAGAPPLPRRLMVRSIERQRCLPAASGQRPTSMESGAAHRHVSLLRIFSPLIVSQSRCPSHGVHLLPRLPSTAPPAIAA
jgi:hypothetical protein